MKLFKNGQTPSEDAQVKALWRRIKLRPPQDSPCPDAMCLAAYLDGRLPNAETAAMEAHLVHCEQCLETVLLLRETAAERQMPVAREKLDPIHELVPRIPGPRSFPSGIVKGILGLLRPAPVWAVILLLLLTVGSFNLGGRMARDTRFIHTALTAELQFNLVSADLPAPEESRKP